MRRLSFRKTSLRGSDSNRGNPESSICAGIDVCRVIYYRRVAKEGVVKMGKFSIIHGDITKQRVDAIVNAANTELAMGGGVCGAIFSAAGARELEAACAGLGPIKTGEAVITPGFGLPAKYVIHAAGPVYFLQSAEESERLLRAAYVNSLKRTVENGCESVAFPLISSGIYGYPKEEALRVATEAIEEFVGGHDIEVSLVLFEG